MSRTLTTDLQQATQALCDGGVIAYPTEAVYGLGCHPFLSEAVHQLFRIKQRQPEKGLILVASDWSQIEMLIEPIPPHIQAHIQSTWPGAHTWLFPASDVVPDWIRGQHNTIALRISAHPIVQALCNKFCGPIVSTSANISGQPPTRDYRTTCIAFKDRVDCIVPGQVGGLQRPTPIQDAVTGEWIRR